jgi:hypothetical protein
MSAHPSSPRGRAQDDFFRKSPSLVPKIADYQKSSTTSKYDAETLRIVEACGGFRSHLIQSYSKDNGLTGKRHTLTRLREFLEAKARGSGSYLNIAAREILDKYSIND